MYIMGYVTGSVCYVVLIYIQVLSYPVIRPIEIQHTRSKKYVFMSTIPITDNNTKFFS